MGEMTFAHDPEHRVFRLSADGEEVVIPELEDPHRSMWLRRVGRDVTDTLGEIDRQEDWVTNMIVQWDGVARLIDALMAYDRFGHLQSRDWVEEHLTSEQLILIIRRIPRRQRRTDRIPRLRGVGFASSTSY